MFAAIVTGITNSLRAIVRPIGTATRKSPWLTAIAILALFAVAS